jgi:hypothetical protein
MMDVRDKLTSKQMGEKGDNRRNKIIIIGDSRAKVSASKV